VTEIVPNEHSSYMKDGLQAALDLLGQTAKELTWEP
jgi:hypothetical protein